MEKNAKGDVGWIMLVGRTKVKDLVFTGTFSHRIFKLNTFSIDIESYKLKEILKIYSLCRTCIITFGLRSIFKY